jgi:hypothetical protein
MMFKPRHVAEKGLHVPPVGAKIRENEIGVKIPYWMGSTVNILLKRRKWMSGFVQNP